MKSLFHAEVIVMKIHTISIYFHEGYNHAKTIYSSRTQIQNMKLLNNPGEQTAQCCYYQSHTGSFRDI